MPTRDYVSGRGGARVERSVARAGGVPRPAKPARQTDTRDHAPRRLHRYLSSVFGGVLIAVLALGPAIDGDAAAPAPCVGRYVVVRGSGNLVRAAADTIVVDAGSMVIDPSCGAAPPRARLRRGTWRVAAA